MRFDSDTIKGFSEYVVTCKNNLKVLFADQKAPRFLKSEQNIGIIWLAKGHEVGFSLEHHESVKIFLKIRQRSFRV